MDDWPGWAKERDSHSESDNDAMKFQIKITGKYRKDGRTYTL